MKLLKSYTRKLRIDVATSWMKLASKHSKKATVLSEKGDKDGCIKEINKSLSCLKMALRVCDSEMLKGFEEVWDFHKSDFAVE